ncbi:MAG: hypothetical protein DMF15_16160 [Verrucomicrobia bacterium]|nr:MAG: hypothetical protein DMF15_16160 [Verrucomicrobiota bacterium]
MAPEITKEIQLEIAHVLFIDIVGYSKLSVKDQHAAVEQLNQIVRASEQFQRADSAGRLLKVATGDGMGLVFYTNPEAPAQCAVEISRSLKEEPLPGTFCFPSMSLRIWKNTNSGARSCTTLAHAK